MHPKTHRTGQLSMPTRLLLPCRPLLASLHPVDTSLHPTGTKVLHQHMMNRPSCHTGDLPR